MHVCLNCLKMNKLILYVECSSHFWNTEYHKQQLTFMLHVDESKVRLRLLIFFFNVHTSASRLCPAAWVSECVYTYLAWLVVGCCKSRPSLYAHYANCAGLCKVHNALLLLSKPLSVFTAERWEHEASQSLRSWKERIKNTREWIEGIEVR